MIVKLLLLLDCFNLILSAIISDHAMPPVNPKTSIFTAILYTTKEMPSDVHPYPDLIGQCTGALIAKNWIITSKKCLVTLEWKVAVGIYKFFKQNVHRRYNFNVQYVIDSIEINIKLVQIDRDVEASVTKPVAIHPFSILSSRCYAAFWMNHQFKNFSKEHAIISKKLHGYFNHKFGESCSQNETIVTPADNTEKLSRSLCLYPKNNSNPIKLCKNDLGAPFICDGYLVGIITYIEDLHCYNNSKINLYPVTILEAYTEWIYYFTNRDPKSHECLISPDLISIISMMVIYFLILY